MSDEEQDLARKERLRAVGYLPPQGVPFRCNTCRYLVRNSHCVNIHVRAEVSPLGCCNLWAKAGGLTRRE